MAEMAYLDLGRASYDAALALQERLAADLAGSPSERAYLLLVEHDPPVITLGRSARQEHVLAARERLTEAGVQLRHVSRGGQATWHGPGQLVAYPILRLDRYGRGLRRYLRDLEEVVLRLLRAFGLAGQRIEGRTGVWIAREKIAAIGVAVRKWVTYHGLSLNVSSDLSGFALIVPCGLRDAGVTSLSAQLGREVSVSEARRPLIEAAGEVFGMVPVAASQGLADGPAPRQAHAGRLPPAMPRRLPSGGSRERVLQALNDLRLNTVCREARCPNLAECHARGTATFLILGRSCTRACGFCAIGHGRPDPPRGDEPEAVAEAARRLGLRHVVVTSVTRDDLADGGAEQFARTIAAVRRALPQATVEVLTGDFQGRHDSLRAVLEARPDVFNHNVETVRRLYPLVRPRADYARSLGVLRFAAARVGPAAAPRPIIKSGLMVGLGETDEEVHAVLRDLRDGGCEVVTIGQYLAPTPRHLPVARSVEPASFDRWRRDGLAMGFRAVLAGPYVRSSYHAEQLLAP